MEITRKPFQGIRNIVYFNWHFYVLFVVLFTVGLFLLYFLHDTTIKRWLVLALIAGSYSVLASFIVSIYVYDFSRIYKLPWILNNNSPSKILNIHAGFDETSNVIQEKRPNSELVRCDFYNPLKHTEISIERARRKYPQVSSMRIESNRLPFESESMDEVYVIFAAHEIRNNDERSAFFKEVYRVLIPGGTVYVTEHVRDLANCLAYTVGVFHFFTSQNWISTFKTTGFYSIEKLPFTPFVTTFKLTKNGITS